MQAKVKINMGEELTPRQKEELESLRKRYEGVFSKVPEKTSLVQHHINIMGSKVVRLHPPGDGESIWKKPWRRRWKL